MKVLDWGNVPCALCAHAEKFHSRIGRECAMCVATDKQYPPFMVHDFEARS